MWIVLRDSWRSFRRHDGPLLSGAVAFYTLLATAPLGLFAVVIIGLVLGEDAAEGELLAQMNVTLGPEGATFVSEMIEKASEPRASRLASSLGLIFFVVATTRLFSILQAALNHIWGVRTSASLGVKGLALRLLKKRLMAFAMVFVFGFTVLVGVIAKVALISGLRAMAGLHPQLWAVIEFTISVAVMTFMVAMVFKLLPDVRIAWSDIWRGALITALFSTLGALLISYYLGRASAGSMYGAAGSIVVGLLWIYYTAQIFFLGAELTGIWAVRRGRGIHPLPHAVRVVEQEPRFSMVPATVSGDDER